MKNNSIWNEIIKPTILAYLLACAIPGVIAGTYYVYYMYF